MLTWQITTDRGLVFVNARGACIRDGNLILCNGSDASDAVGMFPPGGWHGVVLVQPEPEKAGESDA